ncbi:MAG: PIN domain-containing protein [Candidatus Cloacimonetes bacterium]|nr:PIN domain-containing protein [Candidatus Cloacimonadota bacterium]
MKQLKNLPYIHNDPYDRLLIATAIAENLSFITADKDIQKYDVEWIWTES